MINQESSSEANPSQSTYYDSVISFRSEIQRRKVSSKLERTAVPSAVVKAPKQGSVLKAGFSASII